jgi:hypothetical protein
MFPDCGTQLRSRTPGRHAWCTNGQTAAVLLLIDLDNTLIDRTGAFKGWAVEYVTTLGGDSADAEWIIAADETATNRANAWPSE